MGVENEWFFVFKSFANKSQSQNTDLLDQQILIVNVWTDLLYDTIPFISWYFDTANCCNNIGSSSSDVTISIDHYTEYAVFNTLFGSWLKVIPQVGFIGSLK